MPSKWILLAALTLAASAGAVRAEDSGFATKSITNLGLTGGAPSRDDVNRDDRDGYGGPRGRRDRAERERIAAPPVPVPQVRNGGSFGTPAQGAVGTGPGVPAPGGGSFGAPRPR